MSLRSFRDGDPPDRRAVPGNAGANRDPEEFAEPDSFDVGREPNRHLGFGWGRHFCLGAQLARIETEIALNALLKHMPDFEVTYLDALEYPPNPFFRGPERLDVTWHPG